MKHFVAIGLALVCAAKPTAQTTSRQSASAAAVAFLERLKQAAVDDDRAAVLRMIRFPATVQASGWNIPVNDRKTLAGMYSEVFTPELRCAIDATGFPRPDQTRPRHLAVQSDTGLSIAGGLISATATGQTFAIARITVPPGVGARTARIERVVPQGPPRGERTLRLTGRLARADVDSFIVAIRPGETLSASIEGFRGHDATVRIREDAEHATLVKQDLGRRAELRATSPQPMRVEVVRLAPFCGPDLTYTLTLTVR